MAKPNPVHTEIRAAMHWVSLRYRILRELVDDLGSEEVDVNDIHYVADDLQDELKEILDLCSKKP